MSPSHGLRAEVPNAPQALRDYALVADGLRGGVVGPQGDIAWLCFPIWDSPTVFDTLIGGTAAYNVHPEEPSVWGGYYEDGTLIWRDRWVTSSGAIVECRDALSFPGDLHCLVILRRVRAVRGVARLRSYLRPKAEYGERPFRSWRQLDNGEWTARSADLRLRWSGSPARSARPTRQPPGLTADFTLQEGEQQDLVLELGDGGLPPESPDPDICWMATEAAWRGSTPPFESTLAPRDARQAFAVLRGLSTPGGGTVAAVTTSLPERADQGRNYDYRYSWIRDQSFVGGAAAAAGAGLELLDGSAAFVGERLLDDGPNLAPAYTATGAPVPAERCLAYPGYPGGNAIAGNHAAKQFQLDAFGEALVMFAQAARLDRLDADGWRAAEVAVQAIESRWQEADGGIWELENRNWTHSRLACVAGIRSICAAGAPGSLVGRWISLSDAILADTAKAGVHPSGRWQRAPDDGRVDAALLLPALHGATTVDDPRELLTFRAVEATLTADGYVYRFKPDERPLGESEGAFLLCEFAMSLTAWRHRDHVSAVRWFERGRSSTGTAGLFTEEFDVQQRQLRGNLPQMFVHAFFLETAARLAAPYDDAGTGAGTSS